MIAIGAVATLYLVVTPNLVLLMFDNPDMARFTHYPHCDSSQCCIHEVAGQGQTEDSHKPTSFHNFPKGGNCGGRESHEDLPYQQNHGKPHFRSRDFIGDTSQAATHFRVYAFQDIELVARVGVWRIIAVTPK